MTNEELDAARAYEAHRLNCGGQFTTVMGAYRHLFVTGWTPATAIDPLVQALTDCGWLGNPEYDADAIRDALAKRGMEIAREQDKAEPFEWADSINWHKIAHRAVMASVRLGKWMSAALDDPKVCKAMKDDIQEWFSAGEPMEKLTHALAHYSEQDKAEPVAPVDREREVLGSLASCFTTDKCAQVIRTYGDERERAGIEAAIAWVSEYYPDAIVNRMRRDLIGGAGK